MADDIGQALAKAIEHQQAGRLGEAEQLCRRILAVDPRHGDALHVLGFIAHQVGREDAAAELIGRAIAVNPNVADYHSNFGIVEQARGELQKAVDAYRRALELRPNFAEIENNLGHALMQQGKKEEAMERYRRAVAIKSDYAPAHNNLGIALLDAGRADEAVRVFRTALGLVPNFAEAHCNLGNALQRMRRWEEAISEYRAALAINPNEGGVHFNLGNALRARGELEDAAVHYRAAAAQSERQADARKNLANVLKQLGSFQEAVREYEAALALSPNDPELYSNLSMTLRELGRLDEAVIALERALKLKPDFAGAWNNLGIIQMEQGYLEESLESYRKAMALAPSESAFGSNLLYTMHFHADCDENAMALAHRQWNHQYARRLTDHIVHHANDRNPDRRLRVGYMSPEFCHHPIGRFMRPLLANHDHQAFEIVCYSDLLVEDGMTRKVKPLADQWRSIAGWRHDEVASQVREDRIDILVDLSLHSKASRLLVFAQKPAPVQASYLAYCSSSGMATMDYRLTDPHLEGAAEKSWYTEKPACLESYWCYEASPEAPAVKDVPALRSGTVTFGCLNSFTKASAPALECWAALLRMVPNSRLVLHAKPGRHRRRAAEIFAANGIDSTRYEFAGFTSFEDYFKRYQGIDVGLDPFPYAGGTTTCDALWMGVPVVTLAGERGVGRGGVSILSVIGLPELIADSVGGYIELAAGLAKNLPRLAAMRATLRDRMRSSALMDAGRFTRQLESIYRMMWKTWCQSAH